MYNCSLGVWRSNKLNAHMAGYDKTTRHGGGVESTGEGASGDGKKTGEACKDNGSLGEGKTAGGSTTD